MLFIGNMGLASIGDGYVRFQNNRVDVFRVLNLNCHWFVFEGAVGMGDSDGV